MRELRQDWRDVFLSFRIARDPRKVLLGAAGVIVTLVFLWFLAWGFHKMNIIHERATSKVIRSSALTFLSDPVDSVKRAAKVFRVKVKKDGRTSHEAPKPRAYVSIGVLVLGLIAIWSFFGGAISRIAAVELAKDERIEIREARKFACKKYWAYLWAPIVPTVGVGIFAGCVVVGGLIGCIPYLGVAVIGLFFPLALLAGFLVALILVGGVAGGAMMMPAISAEGTDSFDGISRAYSYVYSKPWRYLWYVGVAKVYGLICLAFVFLFTWLTVESAFWAGKVGLKALYGKWTFEDIYRFYSSWEFSKAAREGVWTHIWAFVIGIWAHLVWALFWGFVVSMVITASTIVYFLMRKAVDGTEMTEVFEEEEELAEGGEAAAPAEEEKAAEAPKEAKKEEQAPGTEEVKKPRKKKEGESEE